MRDGDGIVMLYTVVEEVLFELNVEQKQRNEQMTVFMLISGGRPFQPREYKRAKT